jgi:hypothetical protein
MKNLYALIFVVFAVSSKAQVTSTFDTDAGGWTFLNSTTTLTPNHSASGGNPAGFVSVTYSANTGTAIQSWIAPAKFLGNHLVRSIGMNLSFDIQQSLNGTNSNANGDVRIESTSVSLVYSLPAKPATAPTWSTYTLKLDESQGWRVNSTAGALATRDQIKGVLRNITSLEIRGTYVTNASFTSGIDNVVLEQRTLLTPPTVSALSASSGDPGTSITITGSNFDAAPANNAVYFGFVKAQITSASATQLVVTIPIGASYGKIKVTNTITGLTSLSAFPFTPTFTGGGRLIPASFAPRIDLPMPYDPKGFSITDIDGDGWVDLAAASNSVDAVDIYRNLGTPGDITTASFSSRITITLPGSGTNGTGLGFADLDGDGLIDMISSSGTSAFSAAFITFRNISTPGNIAFELPEIWSASSDESPIAHIADLDGDGRPELMGGEGSISSAGSTYFWADQNISTPGNIEFGPAIGFFNGSVINGFSGVTTGDLDGDGKSELIINSNQGQSMVVLHNISTPGVPTFEHSFTIPTGQYITSIYIADLNLDGKNDIVWKKTGGQVYIWLNTNSGGALAATDFATEVILTGDITTYGGMTISDLNGDGKPDIVATDATDIGYFENVYTGGAFDVNAFVRAYQLPGGAANTYPTSPITADLNGDHKPELIFSVTNSGASSRISILQNLNTHTPVISVNTVSPLKGAVGSTVTITGNYFSTIPSENKVWFGGVEANVLSSTATEITAEVPAGAGYERVSVVRNGLTSFYHLPFNTTFGSGVSFDNTSFLPPISYPLTGADYDVEVADMNSDGKPEIVAESRIVTGVIRNYGLSYRNVHTTGAITTGSFILDDTTATSARNLKLLDVDSDGRPDILAPEGIYRNTSTASEISYDVNIGVGVNVFNHAWADFNLDGKIDIASTGGAVVSVFENRSPRPEAFVTGTFSTVSAAVNIAKPAADGGLTVADFDNDGLSEFVSTNPTTDNMSVWRNTGSFRIAAAQFAVVGNLVTGDNPGRVYTGDLDVDGKMDLLLYHNTGANPVLLTVFHNQSTLGNIAFTRVDFTLPAAGTVANISDLDGDGRPEILVVSEGTDQFFILKNTSTPGIIDASSFATPFATPVTNPRGITTGDLNADGKPEIIITSAPNSLLIFENAIPIGPVITITIQPTSTAVCNGATTSFSLTASGTTNLTYQWQKFDGTVFNNVANTGGYTGATTSTLSINTTGNFGAGDYRCKVSGDLATDKFSNTVTLTVNVVPTAPTTTSANNCIAAALTLNASGGTNGQYRWYDVATGGAAISGQVNSAYTTPVITTTTTYHVALNNGLCESSRTPVIATIAPIAKPILTPSLQAASATINICAGDVVTITAPSGFTNYTWSNGASTNPITISTSTPSLTLQVTDGAGCTSVLSDALNVVVNPYPTATITPNGSLLTASSGDSYQWHQNGVAVNGATNQSFEFNLLEYGKYLVDVTDNGCTSTSLVFEYLITGLERLNDGIQLYPNPVEENLFVEFKPPYQIQVISASGNMVRSFNAESVSSSFDFSSLSTGIYLLKVSNENQTQYLRIIKK